MVLILLLPLTALTVHSGEYSWSDLDPNLVQTGGTAGAVTFDASGFHLHADAGGKTGVVTFASLSGPANVSFSFLIQQPAPVGATLVVAFTSPYNQSAIDVRINATTGQSVANLVGPSGTVVSVTPVGYLDPSLPFQVLTSFLPPQTVGITLVQDSSQSSTQLDYPSLVGTVPSNLEVLLTSSRGPATATVSAVEITLPAAGNPQYLAAGLVLYLQYGAIAVLALVGFREEISSLGRRVVEAGKRFRPGWGQVAPVYRWVLVVAIVALPVQVWLLTWGSQPYDLFTQELWSYLGNHGNVVSMYAVSPTVPGGIGTNATSFLGSVYAYPPLSAYLFLGAGGLARIIPGTAVLPSQNLGYILKSFWLVFLDATALIVALELRRAHVSDRWVIAGFGVVVLNPGVLLGSIVWGTFDIVVALFLLLFVTSLRRGAWAWAWFFLLLAILTKQTALLFLPLAIPVVFVRAGFWRAVRSGVTALVGAFFTIFPLLLAGLSPTLVFNSTIGSSVLNVPSTAPKGIAPWQLIVSNGDYGIWPLVTALRNGQHGLSRLQYPDYLANQAFGLPYVDVGLGLGAIGIVVLWIVLWRRAQSRGFAIEWPLLLVLSYLWCFEVLTRLSPRYLVLTIPISIILWIPAESRRIGVVLTAALTAVSALSILSVLSLTTAQTPVAGLRPLGSDLPFFLTDGFITWLSVAQLLVILGSFLVVANLMVNDRFPFAPPKLSASPTPPPWTDSPRVSAIVLNYNGGRLGRDCVDSVLASTYSNLEVIVVDNASKDDSLERMRDLEALGRIRVIRNGENEGYSAGNNRGAVGASGSFLLFLNNDTRVAPEAIARMVEEFRIRPGTGACQPVLVSMEDPTKVANAGSELDTLGFHRVVGAGLPIRSLVVRSPTGFAQGAALMVRTSLFGNIGGFEPMLQFDHTDADLSWKVWLAGYQVSVVPNAVVAHAEGATASAAAVARRMYPLVRGQLVMVTKNYEGWRSFRGLASLVAIDLGMMVLFLSLGRRAEARAVARGIRRFVLDLPLVLKARQGVRAFRTITDAEAERRFLRPFNPIEVFALKRRGYGYVGDWPLTQF